MLSQTAEYAVRAVICLGIQPEEAISSQEIARRTQVPAGYLAKVLQTLRRAGLVRSTRGTKGGFVLAAPLNGLNVYQIIQAVDPIVPPRGNLQGDSDDARAITSMQRRMSAIRIDLEQQLRACRIGPIIQKSRGNGEKGMRNGKRVA